jgi:hypothetical protein
MIERLVALAVLAASGVYLANALPLPQGTAARPGPGFFPLAVGVFGAAGSALASYYIFAMLLGVPLPAGKLLE